MMMMMIIAVSLYHILNSLSLLIYMHTHTNGQKSELYMSQGKPPFSEIWLLNNMLRLPLFNGGKFPITKVKSVQKAKKFI